MSDLAALRDEIREFADRRDWQEFHTPKNLSMAICGEAGELAAELQWLTAAESEHLGPAKLDQVRLEIADVAIYLIRLCDVLGVDLGVAVRDKIEINEMRFPA